MVAKSFKVTCLQVTLCEQKCLYLKGILKLKLDMATLDQSETESNEGLIYISQSSRTGASPSDSLVSYPGHLLGGSYLTAEVQ